MDEGADEGADDIPLGPRGEYPDERPSEWILMAFAAALRWRAAIGRRNRKNRETQRKRVTAEGGSVSDKGERQGRRQGGKSRGGTGARFELTLTSVRIIRDLSVLARSLGADAVHTGGVGVALDFTAEESEEEESERGRSAWEPKRGRGERPLKGEVTYRCRQ